MQLNADGTPKHEELIIIPVGSVLTFKIDPCSSVSGNYVISCNAPMSAHSNFNREEFHDLPSLYSTLGQFQASITLFRPGAYTFKVKIYSWSNNQNTKTSIGHFLVPPNVYF